jgi:hypothetical protein
LEHPLITQPVQKPGTEDFRPVLGLWAVNSTAVTFQPIVPNPYMLFSLAPVEAEDLRILFSASSGPTEPAYFFPRIGKSQYWGKGQGAWT